MKAVMFAGGVGTRLWPLSRRKTPKQFEKILNNFSMLQIAVNKLFPDFKAEDIYIATGKEYQNTVAEQLPYLPKANIITEPVMRDVGPAVGLVTAVFAKMSPNEPFVILWGSDHLVKKEAVFRKILKIAENLVIKEPNKLVFVGQKPRYPNQNLGWIEYGKQLLKRDNIKIYEFKTLKYRPDLNKATEFYNDHHHAWNLGYFVTTPKFLWSLFKTYAPDLFTKLKQIQDTIGRPNYEKKLTEIYPHVDKISFDDAILEKINPQMAYVISENLDWSDVGAWDALKEALEKTDDKNVTHGKVLLTDTNDCLVYNYTNQLITTIDVNELLIVNTSDVILICKKTSVPKIKKIVEDLEGTEHEHLI